MYEAFLFSGIDDDLHESSEIADGTTWPVAAEKSALGAVERGDPIFAHPACRIFGCEDLGRENLQITTCRVRAAQQLEAVEKRRGDAVETVGGEQLVHGTEVDRYGQIGVHERSGATGFEQAEKLLPDVTVLLGATHLLDLVDDDGRVGDKMIDHEIEVDTRRT